MNLSIDFNLSTPALIFPAISLLMLAYTNRFVVLADLIRNLIEAHKSNPKEIIMHQILNLQKRMRYIKKMQQLGAAAFIVASLSMLSAMLMIPEISAILFIISLITLITSLVFLLLELSISIDALTLQLNELSQEK